MTIFKNLIKALEFKPKENSSEIFQKKYNSYAIEVDFEKDNFFGRQV